MKSCPNPCADGGLELVAVEATCSSLMRETKPN